MDRFQFNRFIPITKVDDEQRMVYGWASTPDLDSDGEVITVKAMEKALPEYMKFPTIREMHQPKAAGTTKHAEIREDKTGKGLYIGAKIVSDEAWKLVKEGVYKGFSVGGHVLNRVKNIINGIALVEISLVDVPANKQAKIEIWKTDKTQDYFKNRISMLEKMDLEDPKANLIREGVIDAMKTKSEELAKQDETAVEEIETTTDEEVVEETVASTEEQETEEAVEETEAEEEAEEETAEESEDKEVSDMPTTLEKLTAIDKKLEKVLPSTETAAKLSLEKSVSAMAGTVGKIADTIISLEQRLSKLESTPAAIKSKAAIVHKAIGDNPDTIEDKKEDSNTELGAKKARLVELSKMFDKVGPAQFAKLGYSQEAQNLEAEVSYMEGRA